MIPVYYLSPPSQEAVDDLQSKLDPRINLASGDGEPVPADTMILIAGRPQRDHLLSAPNLHTLIIPWSGLPDVTRELMLDFPSIHVHNLHHNAAPVAEAVLALLLAAAKHIVPLDKALRQGDWRPRYRPSQAVLLRNKTALILGYGAIGRQVAGMCRQLGMKVLAIKRTVETTTDDLVDEIQPASALDRLLPRTQALIITLPHTPETDGLIGERELKLLPQGAVLVNVGRGPIVDENALFRALRNGHLHSAGLDVWYN
jgi:phosphoglycerate dehydrogenase-like enzyme